MLSKEKFSDYLRRIQDLQVVQERINDALNGLSNDHTIFLSFDRHEDIMVRLLMDAVGDVYDLTTWYLYELPDVMLHKATKEDDSPPLMGANGKAIPCETPEDIYDAIRKIQGGFVELKPVPKGMRASV